MTPESQGFGRKLRDLVCMAVPIQVRTSRRHSEGE
jgi:hypothetical protein